MAFPFLKEGFTEWEVIINPDLKFARAETWKHGIKRYWGFDPTDSSQKLMYVQYPKNKYSRVDMMRILPKYKGCKLCVIGKKLINKKNNNTNMDYSIINLVGKTPAIGNLVTRNRGITEPLIMQGLATLTRYPLAIMNTELGKRLFSLLIGAAGLAGVNYIIKNATLRGEWFNFFSNYISSAGELNALKSGSGFGVSEDLAKLKRSIKTGNFGGIADSLLKDATTVKRRVKGVVRGYKGSFDNAFHLLRGGRRLRPTENTMPNKLFGGNGTKFAVKNAGDFKYNDTSKRFKDISAFGSGFRKERRFRESGDAVYQN